VKLVALSILLICSTAQISFADATRCLTIQNTRRCWVLKKITPIEIPAGHNFTALSATELGVNTDQTLMVGISWKGEGGGEPDSGIFKFAGPHGEILAGGSFTADPDGKKHVYFNEYDDQSIDKSFDLSLVFHENDLTKLHAAVLDWLNLVIAPYLEKHLMNEPAVNQPPR